MAARLWGLGMAQAPATVKPTFHHSKYKVFGTASWCQWLLYMSWNFSKIVVSFWCFASLNNSLLLSKQNANMVLDVLCIIMCPFFCNLNQHVLHLWKKLGSLVKVVEVWNVVHMQEWYNLICSHSKILRSNENCSSGNCIVNKNVRRNLKRWHV